jgi:hypothetical protein
MDFPAPILSPIQSPSVHTVEFKSTITVTSKPKTFNQWVLSAKAATAETLANGSQLPFAWVRNVIDFNYPNRI